MLNSVTLVRLGKLFPENGQNVQFFVLCFKSVFRYWPITFLIFSELATLEPPKKGHKGSPEGHRKNFYCCERVIIIHGSVV